MSGGPGGLLWLAVPLVVERNLLWGLFPERHMLTSDWSNHALLFVAYTYGFVLAGSPWLGAAIDAQWRRTLTAGAGATGVLVAGTWLGFIPTRLPPPYSLGYLSFWTLYALCAWAWMVGLLGAGRRWLRHEGPVLRYGREAAYAWYIMHQPIIVAVAYVVVQWQTGVAIKFSVIFVVSAAATVLVVDVLRRLPIAGTLIGMTPTPARVTD